MFTIVVLIEGNVLPFSAVCVCPSTRSLYVSVCLSAHPTTAEDSFAYMFTFLP